MGQKNKRVFFFFLLQRLFRNEGHKFIVFRTIFWRGKNNEINNLFDGLSYKNQALKKVKFFSGPSDRIFLPLRIFILFFILEIFLIYFLLPPKKSNFRVYPPSSSLPSFSPSSFSHIRKMFTFQTKKEHGKLSLTKLNSPLGEKCVSQSQVFSCAT